MGTIQTTHTIFSPPSSAHEMAKSLQEDDGEWTYKVVVNPVADGPDTAIIKIYDANGVFISNF